MTLRQVEPIDIRGLSPRTPPTGAPIFETVDPRTLFVDPSYQRGLGERSIRQIRRIVETFDWTRFKPPVCAFSEAEDGTSILKVIDGQHTAISAASNPHVGMIPVMIVEAPDVPSQALAFIGQNTDRLGVTKTQLYVAALAAGQEEAQAIARVCEKIGIRILKSPPSGGAYQPGDTVAVAAIEALVKKDGEAVAAFTLSYLASAGLAPVKSDHIKAFDLLLTDPQFGSIELDAIANHIRVLGEGAMKEAKTFAATHTVPLWKALASVWFQKAKKRKGARPTDASPPESVARQSVESGRPPSDHHHVSPLPEDLQRDLRSARGGWAPGNQIARCRECSTVPRWTGRQGMRRVRIRRRR